MINPTILGAVGEMVAVTVGSRIISSVVQKYEKKIEDKVANKIEESMKKGNPIIFHRFNKKKHDNLMKIAKKYDLSPITVARLCSTYYLAYLYSDYDEMLDKLYKLGCIEKV